MSTALGPLTVKSSFDAGGIASGARQAEMILKSQSAQLAKASQQAGEQAGKSLAAGFARYALLGAGALGAAGAGGLLYAWKEGSERIRALGEAARGSASDLASFQAIHEALGGNLELTSKAMAKLTESLTRAQFTQGETAFSRLGLDLDQLLGGTRLEAVGLLADRLSGISDQFQRAALAAQIFGGELAGKVLPHLLRGSEHFQRMHALLEKFGASFGSGALATAQRAAEAWRELGLVWVGLSNQVALLGNAIVAELAERLPGLADWGVSARGLAEALVGALERLALSVAFVADAWGEWRTLFGGLTASWQEFYAGILEDLAELVDRQLPTVEQRIARLLGVRGARLFATAALTAGVPLEPAGAGLRAHAAQARAAAAQFWEEWQQQVDRGVRPASAAVSDFFAALRDRLQQTAEAVERHNPFVVLAERGKQLAGQMTAPLDEFKKKLAEIKQLEEAQVRLPLAVREKFAPGGVVPGGERTLNQAAFQAFQQLRTAAGFADEPRYAGTLLAGSREAYSAELAYRAADRDDVPGLLRRILEAIQRQAAIEQEVGRGIRDGFENLDLELRRID